MNSSRLSRLARAALIGGALLAGGLVSGCAAVVDRHGFLPVDGNAPEVSVGTDTRTTVLTRLGNPSQQSVFDEQIWYYISAVQSQEAFYLPRTTERSVTAIVFDDMDTVAEVRRYGLRDGRIIDYDTRRTPTRGREVTVVEQLLGSVGRAPVALPNQDPNLPGSSGGPRRQ